MTSYLLKIVKDSVSIGLTMAAINKLFVLGYAFNSPLKAHFTSRAELLQKIGSRDNFYRALWGGYKVYKYSPRSFIRKCQGGTRHSESESFECSFNLIRNRRFISRSMRFPTVVEASVSY